MIRYAIIGDVHSQDGPLEAALGYCRQTGLTPLLLGDLFDSRCEFGNSLKVYDLVRNAQTEFKHMVALRSNHQNKLERYLKGNPVNVTPDLRSTLDDFSKGSIKLEEELLPWLNSFPYGFVFRDSRKKEYRCAHAYFPSRLEIPKYAQYHKVYKVNRKERDLMIYGLKKRSEESETCSERVLWWLRDKLELSHDCDWVRVAGHYHYIYADGKSLVLDGNMGGRSKGDVNTEDMALCLYDVEGNKLVKFFFNHHETTSIVL
jgi:hypothetical protein